MNSYFRQFIKRSHTFTIKSEVSEPKYQGGIRESRVIYDVASSIVPRKFIPSKIRKSLHPRKFIPAKRKYFEVRLNRD